MVIWVSVEEIMLVQATDVICRLPPDRARREITLYLSYPCPRQEYKQSVSVCVSMCVYGV